MHARPGEKDPGEGIEGEAEQSQPDTARMPHAYGADPPERSAGELRGEDGHVLPATATERCESWRRGGVAPSRRRR